MRTFYPVKKTTRPQGASTVALLDPQRLVERRVVLGLLQKEVAERARISPQYLADIEAGRRQGSPPVRAALAKALRLPLADLLKQEHVA